MLTKMRKVRPYAIAVSIPGSDHITTLTKNIRFKATPCSKAMDLCHGGYRAHGGFHRVYGGHSVADFRLLKRYGLRYVGEVGKDTLTKNGVPLPGVETAVRSKTISASAACKWGSMNIGKILASGIAAMDTAFLAHKFVSRREDFNQHRGKQTFKAAVKVISGLSSCNAPLVAVGSVDFMLIAYSKLEERVDLQLNSSQSYFSTFDTALSSYSD